MIKWIALGIGLLAVNKSENDKQLVIASVILSAAATNLIKGDR